LQAATRKLPRATLIAALEAANVPAGPINTVAEALSDPQALARGVRTDLPATGVTGGTAPALRSPMRIDGEALVAARAAPRLGEHTRETLAGLGLGETDLARLRAAGVIG
jgi:crotonobetainyl-CoA:carnitine CoA-transferase CaiB-like acyl-CoA transferase